MPDVDLYPDAIPDQRVAMLGRMKAMLGLTEEQQIKLRGVLDESPITGQGNPKITEYAMTRKECLTRRKEACVVDPVHEVCGAPYMVPLYDKAKGEAARDARVCIDAYEFPGIPCDYPVTWVSPRQAELMCEAIGKRLCDAHEWEGACAGSLRPVEEEYDFERARSHGNARHNKAREKVWAYGKEKDDTKCGTGSRQNKKCVDSRYKVCGSNTYPTGSFPECKSSFGVYDQHGNAAEHMGFPRKLEDLGARGGHGMTEMKGSWFIFQRFTAHEDDCRWRAPAWHESALMAVKGHANYHLGFRCCKDTKPPAQ